MKRQMALMRAKLPTHDKLVNKALGIIADALLVCDSWMIAISGGKDSTVVFDLVRRVAPDTVAVCSKPKWILPETDSYLSKLSNIEFVASGSDHNTGWASNWNDESELPNGIRWLGDRGQVKKRYGRDERGVFLGLRKTEHKRREVHLNTFGSLYHAKNNECWQCNPIADWTVWDVWAYIYANDIAYNLAYDKMDKIGIPVSQQRIGPLAVERALGYGQLSTLKRGWPDLFNAYATEHPEARNYV